ncbi:MAG: helix-turn-helix transcriptional regulator [Gammaproteobacteria bacterium]|nr:helix-turn-helix transcriptional regulator [Gammaproteobacteria bacterium]
MSRIRQTTLPLDPTLPALEALPQSVVAYGRDLQPGQQLPAHHHRRAQLVHASHGLMTVTTDSGAFVVPPEQAVWVPGGVQHRIEAHGQVAMRTLYIEPDALPELPADVRVFYVSPLLRELVVAAVAIAPHDFGPGSRGERLIGVILDELRAMRTAPLALPMPSDPRLQPIVAALVADPADTRTLAEWTPSTGASERTLMRLFQAQTGMSFREWRGQCRLLRALELLASGAPVTTVALELGYESTSAFIAMFRRRLGVTPTRYLARGGIR